MNFQTMDYFVAVAEERSFTRAAKRLNVTQQTLSANVAAAERELGVTLVERKVPLVLTGPGHRFLAYARKFQATERSMEQEFADIAHDERGLLGVGIANTRSHILLPEVIADFRARRPGIDFDICEAENSQLLGLLKDGVVDIAVGTFPGVHKGYEVRPLCEQRVSLVAARSLLEGLYGERADEVVARVERTGSLEALAGCPFLLLGEHDVPGDVARAELARVDAEPEVAAFSTNSETLLGLARRGVGAAFCTEEMLSRRALGPDAEGLVVVRLPERTKVQVSVAWRRAEHVWSQVLAFYEALVAHVGLLSSDGVGMG
ncbi:MAG: LysR family transcriptional regulator [Atopobiaceae bacterium]|jgi:DNA-binding transcriptional LysR family regulator|nr:LysR family transcriptional regulator [Atopobiaceae bacterium]MCH4119094.1 LysR family transcriptional regulator [Atopobiaceae bacterium]MCI1318172.1 LysR family transcriptional regulator [Atopobiaceae bacterium]MCI1388647.1 LysR family transcriptional regulator [Atopobiaceae bacterium]MCI1432146.1 LysR family transcriptional regulator [Atopobiaceae bacterium]